MLNYMQDWGFARNGNTGAVFSDLHKNPSEKWTDQSDFIGVSRPFPGVHFFGESGVFPNGSMVICSMGPGDFITYVKS